MMKKQTISSIQKKIWQHCRRIADIMWTKDGITRCYTCDKVITGSNKHLGHFIPKGACGANLKYDMQNLRWQCYHDNINLGGNGAEFYRRLVKNEGQKYVNELFKRKNVTVKAMDYYIKLLDEYENIK